MVKVVRDDGGAIVDYDDWDDEEPAGCCALDDGHEGPCAYLCSDCHGTERCWACNGHDPGDDLGSACSECDGHGHCMSCHDGLVDA